MIISKTKLEGLILKGFCDILEDPLVIRNGLRPNSNRFTFGWEEGAKGFAPDISHIQRDETFFRICPPIKEDQFGTSGIDLSVGNLISWSDTVADNVTLDDMLSMKHKVLNYGDKFILKPNEKGERVYYIQSREAINFSDNLDIMIDSKSTTGRVGGMSHGVGRTKDGNLITILQPYSFPLEVECGKTRLSQVIVRYKDTPYMTNEEILKDKEIGFSGEDIYLRKALTPKGLLMQFDTKIAYRAKKCNKPINMDAKATVDWKDYFEVIEENSSITLDKNRLYLMGSLGVFDLGRVYGILSREQEVITGAGAWGHFAGIFQPGFQGGITMEVYSHTKRKISRGDKAGVVLFDKVETGIGEPLAKIARGSYQGQRPPTLPKMFKIN